jgi:hypothetical protein
MPSKDSFDLYEVGFDEFHTDFVKRCVCVTDTFQCATVRLDISPLPSILFDGHTPTLDMTYWYFALFVHFSTVKA